MEISRLYSFVRSRQLEGTYPQSPEISTWLITNLRISRGWGNVSEKDWPYPKKGDDWPPIEPAGLDEKAKRARILCYQRVRSVDQCKSAIALSKKGVRISLGITQQWFNAPRGLIELPADQADISAAHCVRVVGYDDGPRLLRFRNSWGDWGENGHGYLPYEYLDKYMTEGWIENGFGEQLSARNGEGLLINWGVTDFVGGILHGIDAFDSANDDRIGWTFLVVRDGFLDVEEFFVRPSFRNRGLGTKLAESVLELRNSLRLPLRYWIPHVDRMLIGEKAQSKVLSILGLSCVECRELWAGGVALNRSGQSGQNISQQLPLPPSSELFGEKPWSNDQK